MILSLLVWQMITVFGTVPQASKYFFILNSFLLAVKIHSILAIFFVNILTNSADMSSDLQISEFLII
jgi:hypothetical protein